MKVGGRRRGRAGEGEAGRGEGAEGSLFNLGATQRSSRGGAGCLKDVFCKGPSPFRALRCETDSGAPLTGWAWRGEGSGKWSGWVGDGCCCVVECAGIWFSCA